MKIPGDIALVGFTDEFHSTVVDPTLTSVTHPTFEMGQQAAKLFFQIVQKESNFEQQIVLKTELVVRESSVKKNSSTLTHFNKFNCFFAPSLPKGQAGLRYCRILLRCGALPRSGYGIVEKIEV